jgi:hypothetical protein
MPESPFNLLPQPYCVCFNLFIIMCNTNIMNSIINSSIIHLLTIFTKYLKPAFSLDCKTQIVFVHISYSSTLLLLQHINFITLFTGNSFLKSLVTDRNPLFVYGNQTLLTYEKLPESKVPIKFKNKGISDPSKTEWVMAFSLRVVHKHCSAQCLAAHSVYTCSAVSTRGVYSFLV